MKEGTKSDRCSTLQYTSGHTGLAREFIWVFLASFSDAMQKPEQIFLLTQ